MVIMLNKSERHKVLQFWKVFCVVGQLPIEVDLTNWQLKTPTTKKQCICIVAYGLYVLHSFYKASSLVYTYLFVPDIQLHQLIIHAVLATTSVMFAYWYYVLYIQNPGLLAASVRMTLVGNIGGTPDQNGGLKKHWRRRLLEYSMQDLIAMSSPYLVILSISAVSCTYMYDPSMRLLLYSALPTYLQNWATFGLLLLEEVRFLMVLMAVATPVWQIHVITFDLVCSRLLALTQMIEDGKVTARNVYKDLRSIQLYVSMFNKLNSYLIFTWKLVSILECVTCGFAALTHFNEHVLFGIMYYVLLLDAGCLYMFIYEKAFKIPRLFKEAASCAQLHMCRNRRNGFSKQISSISPAAIKVGDFHKMERASTLIFISFVVTNIVSLLVAFG